MLTQIKNLSKEKNFASLMANVSAAFLGLLSFMLLTRQLSTELFGDWVLYITLATFVDSLRYGLTRTSVVRLLSGAPKADVKRLLGSSYRLNALIFLVNWIVFWLILWILETAGWNIPSGYRIFLIWYPLLSLAGLGWKNAYGLFQAEQNFKRMLWVRVSNVGLFVVFLIANGIWLHLDLTSIIIANILVNGLSSLWCSVKKWDGLLYMPYATRETEKELYHFGKYSMGTLVGSNLLKSADTFIIGMSTLMGPEAIAMYAIPLKLTDLLGIPLRSFSMTAYPRLSRKFLQNDMEGLKRTFYSYSGLVTMAFIPVAIFCFIFAEPLIYLLGGEAYTPVMEELVAVFRIFTVYTVLLPFDRFLGVLFDSINRPNLNLFKVMAMASANIVIDLIAVFVFHSLQLVALGTVAFTLVGIFMGLHYIRKHVEVRIQGIVVYSIGFIRNIKTYLPG